MRRSKAKFRLEPLTRGVQPSHRHEHRLRMSRVNTPGFVVECKCTSELVLGCYPLTGAVKSHATTLPEIIQEMLLATTSERQGRLIDSDSAGSMEQKKREGYF